MANSKIEWTQKVWNPVTGCTKISAGCQNCYAEKMALRLQKMGVEKYRNGFNITPHPKLLNEPYIWKKPKMVFVNSMSDLFHPSIPIYFVQDIFKVIKDNPQHIFQILTKRPDMLNWYIDRNYIF